ncbi:MAG: DUF4381 domain-containing protein [Gammaproteobacteria bacterium]|nr:DUF4381 domain-containing protein [Gammaproteobacteria bacterium]
MIPDNPLAQDPLAELRDIHLPDPVSWWPPAPGWWLLALVVLVALGLASWALRRYLKRRRRSRRVLAEVDALAAAYRRDGDTQALCSGLSLVLKRAALAAWPRQRVAGLTGTAWLEFLDATGGAGAFAHGPGQALASAGYGGAAAVDGEALEALVRRWIKGALRRVPA